MDTVGMYSNSSMDELEQTAIAPLLPESSLSESSLPSALTQMPSSMAPRSPLVDSTTNGLRLTIKGKNQRVLGTSMVDRLDASKGKGNNTLIGKGSNDKLKGKKKDKLLGGGGRDRLDTRKGRQNLLKGGGGSDKLFVGKKDKAFGNGGADTLDASKGRGQNILNGGGGDDVLIGKMGDRLVGGKGSDAFVIIKGKLPTQVLTVQDFEPGRDRLVSQNFAGVTGLSDFTLTQQGQDTLVAAQGQAIAILENVTASTISGGALDEGEAIDTIQDDDAEGVTPVQEDDDEVITTQFGNQYSITSVDAQNILFQFDLSGLNSAGDFIADDNSSDSVGVFIGAIKNYVSGSGILPFGVDPEPFVADGATTIDSVNLRAELVQDAERNAFITDGRDTIEYILTTPENSELLRLSLDFTSGFFSGFFSDFNSNLAINSMAYIVENDVLEYASVVQDGGGILFAAGGTENTQPSKTYTKTLVGQDSETRVVQFRVVAAQQELAIADQDATATDGLFLNAIENYTDDLTSQSFALGDLSSQLSGTTVTYTISDGSISKTAQLDLANTDFFTENTANQPAINDLNYIIQNDLLKRAFFPFS